MHYTVKRARKFTFPQSILKISVRQLHNQFIKQSSDKIFPQITVSTQAAFLLIVIRWTCPVYIQVICSSGALWQSRCKKALRLWPALAGGPHWGSGRHLWGPRLAIGNHLGGQHLSLFLNEINVYSFYRLEAGIILGTPGCHPLIEDRSRRNAKLLFLYWKRETRSVLL